MHTYDLLFLRRVLSGRAGAILAFAPAHDEPARKAVRQRHLDLSHASACHCGVPKGKAGRFGAAGFIRS
jgi:hypothetical protein